MKLMVAVVKPTIVTISQDNNDNDYDPRKHNNIIMVYSDAAKLLIIISYDNY